MADDTVLAYYGKPSKGSVGLNEMNFLKMKRVVSAIMRLVVRTSSYIV